MQVSRVSYMLVVSQVTQGISISCTSLIQIKYLVECNSITHELKPANRMLFVMPSADREVKTVVSSVMT